MKDNPFASQIFTTTWLKHFYSGKSGYTFNFIHGLSFVKFPFFSLFINVGKNHTKGMYYDLSKKDAHDFKNKVFLIYDVPTYFNIKYELCSPLKVIKIKQYPGYLIKLQDYNNFQCYIDSVFNRKSRYKLKSYKKQLEFSPKIHYKMYYGSIPKKVFDNLFEQFKNLLKKRFVQKQETNNNLDAQEWAFYTEVVYPMILEKRASINAIYDDKKPIGIMLNYMSDDSIFVAITVFDIDYSKFNIGTINIMNLIEWAFENNFKIIDFSKGQFNYKKRWGSLEYDFDYHIVYNSSSFYSNCIARCLIVIFKLKQFLRTKGINKLFHKFIFYLKK